MSWTAVGWSNTSVLGSGKTFATFCSLLRSSTAPSESIPASISGASASTFPPAVWRAISRTAASETAFTPVDCTSATAAAFSSATGATTARKLGTADLPPRNRLHTTGSMLSTDGAPGCVAAPSAASPFANSMRSMPNITSIASIRFLAAPRAAMPTSAQAPHCTLVPAWPRTRRQDASESRHALAAA